MKLLQSEIRFARMRHEQKRCLPGSPAQIQDRLATVCVPCRWGGASDVQQNAGKKPKEIFKQGKIAMFGDVYPAMEKTGGFETVNSKGGNTP